MQKFSGSLRGRGRCCVPLLKCALILALSSGVAVSGTTTYTYDVHGRLTNESLVVVGADQVEIENVYDNATNRTTVQTVLIDHEAPTTPVALVASAVSSSEVTLSWYASTDVGSSGLAGYKVKRSGAVIATVTGISHSDPTVSGGTNYQYTVAAFDNSGNVSAESEPASVTTPPDADTVSPSVPTGLAAAPVSSTWVNLSWNGSTDTGGSGLAGYHVYRNGSYLATSAVASFSDTTTTGSTSYSYTVVAYDGAGNTSDASAAAAVTTPDSIAPSAPVGLSAVAVSSNAVNLNWVGSSDTGGSGLAGYHVYRNGSYLATSAVASFSDTTSMGSTSYSYAVVAYDGAGNTSGASAAVAVTTPDSIAPSVPTGLAAAAVSSNTVSLTWTGSLDTGGSGLAGYYVYRNGSYLATSTVTSFSDVTTAGSTSYSYTVVAYDGAGNTSGASSAATVSTPDSIAPSAPTSLYAGAPSTQVSLSWVGSTDTGGSGLAGYQIYRNGSQIAVTTATTYTDISTSGGVTYSYTVAAYDNASNVSPHSNTATITTPQAWIPVTNSGGAIVSAAQSKYQLYEYVDYGPGFPIVMRQLIKKSTLAVVWTWVYGGGQSCAQAWQSSGVTGYRMSTSICAIEANPAVY